MSICTCKKNSWNYIQAQTPVTEWRAREGGEDKQGTLGKEEGEKMGVEVKGGKRRRGPNKILPGGPKFEVTSLRARGWSTLSQNFL